MSNLYQTTRHDVLVLAVGDLDSRRRQDAKYPEEVLFLVFSRYCLLLLQLTVRHHDNSGLPMDPILSNIYALLLPRSTTLQWTSRCRRLPIPFFDYNFSYRYLMRSTHSAHHILLDLWHEQYQVKGTICNACQAHLSIWGLMFMQERLYKHAYPDSFFLDPEVIKNLRLGVICNFSKGYPNLVSDYGAQRACFKGPSVSGPEGLEPNY
jgi:hypothetical protein